MKSDPEISENSKDPRRGGWGDAGSRSSRPKAVGEVTTGDLSFRGDDELS